MLKRLIEKFSGLFSNNVDDETIETKEAVSEQPEPVSDEADAELNPETEPAPKEELSFLPEDEQCEIGEAILPEDIAEEEKILICKGCGSKVSSKSSFCQVCGEKVY